MRPQHLILASLFAASTSFAAFAQSAAQPAQPAQSPAKEGEKGKAPEGQPAGRPNRPGAGAQGRNALSPEKAKAAWEAQATGVAKRHALSADQTKTLLSAYSTARESQQTASQKLRDDLAAKGGGAGGPEAMAEIMTATEDMNKAEKAKFEKALTGFKAEEITKVSSGLSTFNRQWDGITNAMLEMKLEEAKQQDAFVAVEDFIVGQSRLRARAGADVDREAMRTAMTENRTKLTDALAKVLTPEQAKTVEESIGQARGGRGGAGGAGGGGAGGPGGAGGGRPATAPAGDKKPEGPK